MRRTFVTIGLIAAVWVLGQALGVLGVPAPLLFAGMLVGLALAMARGVEVRLPGGVYALSQGILGASIGTLGKSLVGGSGRVMLAVPLAVLATMVMSLVAGRLLARHRLLGLDTGMLGMVAGGSTAVVAAADETGADARVVAVSQYLRVVLVALTAPLVALWLSGGTPLHVVAGPPHEQLSEQVFSGISVLAVAVAGIWAGRRVRLPAAPLAGPLVLGMVLAVAGAVPEAAPPAWIPQLALGLVGAEIGLRFEPAALRKLRLVLPSVLALTVGLSLGCAAVGIAVSRLAGVPALDAYLMTTPGGINAVLATAMSLHGVDVGVVTLAQVLRLLAMVLVVPALVRVLSRRQGVVQEALT
jgi:hypothetical protein